MKQASRTPLKRVQVTTILCLVLVFFGSLVWWLTRPSERGTIAIAARTGALTLDVLCGGSVTWDLGSGKVLLRSAEPGTPARDVDGLTLTIHPGARVRLEANSALPLRLSIEPLPIARSCGGAEVPLFEATTAGLAMEADPRGMSYLATDAKQPGVSTRELTLVLNGHVQLGQAVQQGAGWTARAGGILEAGSITLRVVPTFSHERVTLETEQVDEGSLVDTHACLKQAGGSSEECPALDAPPALGFARIRGDGVMQVQLYTRGPVGMQAYAGAGQQQLTVPNYISAWRSEVLRIWGGLLTLVLAFWNQLIAFSRFVKNVSSKGLLTAIDEMLGSHAQEGNITTNEAAVLQEHELRTSSRRPPNHNSGTVLAALAVLLGAGALALSAGRAFAEPVEVRQGSLTGLARSWPLFPEYPCPPAGAFTSSPISISGAPMPTLPAPAIGGSASALTPRRSASS